MSTRGPSKAAGRKVETKGLECSNVEGRIHFQSKTGAPYLRTGDGCRELQEYDDQFAEPDFTGRWIDRVGRYNFFVNQAGPYLEILWTLVVNGNTPRVTARPDGTFDDPRPTELAFRLSGRMEDGSFALYDTNRSFVGWLRVASSKKLVLDLAIESVEPKLREFHESTMKRMNRRPSLFERYLGDPSVPPSLRTAHWFPLTPQQEKLTSSLILETKVPVETHDGPAKLGLGGLIEWYYIVDSEFSSEPWKRENYQRRAIEGIERLVKKVFGDAQILPAPGGGIHQDQHAFHSLNALRAIEAELLPVGEVSRSAAYHLQKIVNDWPSESWRAVRRNLGIAPQGPNYYEATLDVRVLSVSGVVLGVADYQGVLNVRRTTAPTFDLFYPIGITGGSVGKSVAPIGGGQLVSEGSSGPAPSWLPEHIPGTCILSDLSATVGVGSTGGSGGVTALSCTGNDGSPRGWLSFTFEGASKFFGLSGGMGLTGCVGYIGQSASDYDSAVKMLSSIPKDIDVILAHTTRYAHHYVVNNARLTEEGEWAVGSIVATELAAFRSGDTTVLIIGHADRNDEETKNEELSGNRAANVAELMRKFFDSEGPPAELVPKAASEFEHAAVEPDPEALDEEYRRVDIFVNSAVVAKLRGPRERPRARTK